MKPVVAVHVIEKNGLAAIATAHQVVPRAGILDAQLARHVGKVGTGWPVSTEEDNIQARFQVRQQVVWYFRMNPIRDFLA